MQAIKIIRSTTVVLPFDDIDTDQIIPARFLTTTTKTGLGTSLFNDWRYDADGKPKPDFVLNSPASKGAAILIGGRNFGCGSSREHAPWALIDFGIRAVVSTEIADIFRNNSLKNGLVPVLVDSDTHAWLMANPGVEITIDLERRTLELPDGREIAFPIDGFSRYCLMNGLDQMGYLLESADAIDAYEAKRA
ncbi:MAG TPA: 3-isopropylmalate dehydratase small subunit [Gammaproteobacteria bacterium]|nr:3-isopropylmalate dehydratase small subunit [Gammaproteobacteria bacterium]